MPTPKQVGLYRLYNAADQLLYIGITSDPKERWRQHQGDKSWWPEVTRKTIEWIDDRGTALSREASAIKTERPLYNGTHRSAAQTTADDLLGSLPDLVADHLRSRLGGQSPSEADFPTLINTIGSATELIDVLSECREALIATADETGPYADRQVLAKAAGMPRSRLYRILERFGRPTNRKEASS